MKTREQNINEKKQRISDAKFIAVIFLLFASFFTLGWGDGATQGYSLPEQILGIFFVLAATGIGYLIGYFLPIRKWMN